MKATLQALYQRPQGMYCHVCGRSPQGVSRGDCTKCTSLFELQKGRKLYNPLTGNLWLKSVGNGTLVNVTDTSHRAVISQRAPCSRKPVRVPWWPILVVLGTILSECLRLIFRGK